MPTSSNSATTDESARREALTRELLDVLARHTPVPFAPLRSEEEAEVKWLRVKDAVRIYGIGRSRLYALIKDGTVRSASICKKHHIRGARRVLASSLDAYYDRNAQGGNTP